MTFTTLESNELVFTRKFTMSLQPTVDYVYRLMISWERFFKIRRLPAKASQRIAYAEHVGRDGHVLLDALWSAQTPAWLREMPAVERLRRR